MNAVEFWLGFIAGAVAFFVLYIAFAIAEACREIVTHQHNAEDGARE